MVTPRRDWPIVPYEPNGSEFGQRARELFIQHLRNEHPRHEACDLVGIKFSIFLDWYQQGKRYAAREKTPDAKALHEKQRKFYLEVEAAEAEVKERRAEKARKQLEDAADDPKFWGAAHALAKANKPEVYDPKAYNDSQMIRHELRAAKAAAKGAVAQARIATARAELAERAAKERPDSAVIFQAALLETMRSKAPELAEHVAKFMAENAFKVASPATTERVASERDEKKDDELEALLKQWEQDGGDLPESGEAE